MCKLVVLGGLGLVVSLLVLVILCASAYNTSLPSAPITEQFYCFHKFCMIHISRLLFLCLPEQHHGVTVSVRTRSDWNTLKHLTNYGLMLGYGSLRRLNHLLTESPLFNVGLSRTLTYKHIKQRLKLYRCLQ